MIISYNWLKDYLKFDLQPEKVAAILTSTGLEVEHVEVVEQIPGGLEGVVVAEVVECADHPDSDHLHVTKLNIGAPELLQVVCGAPNVAAGQKVLLATVGTKLVTFAGEEIKLKKSKIRGMESNGMICAEDELGIGADHEGIMVLPADAVPGTPAKVQLQLKNDTVYEIGLTPNRIDGASHIGVARDLYAWCKLNGVAAEWTLPDVSAFKEGAGEAIPVEVLAPKDAPRYVGITIKNVKVGPSPEWLRDRMNAVGQRPVNNVVDVTNFILNEMCQPLHAFDAAMIKGGKVIVRRAADGETLVTLDGVERKLTTEDLVIANSQEPMCLAGVFGGEHSGVTENTTEIFLESAYFNPVTIRKSSKRHGIKTDSSFRFERGIDPCNTIYAAKRAAMLIAELTGGEIVGNIVESYPEKIEKSVVELDYGRIQRLIGKQIPADIIKDILISLDFNIIEENETGAKVEVPSYRVDVTRECDVVEEILRIYGYDNVEFPDGMKISVNPSLHPDPEVVRADVSNFFTHKGFVEIMNNSLTKGAYYTNCNTFPDEKSVRLLNPLSTDLDTMRQTLIFGGLEVISYNIKHQNSSLKLYEIGNVYSYSPKADNADAEPAANLKSYREAQRLALFISKPAVKFWHNELGGGSYFMMKGYLELLLKRFNANSYDLEMVPAPQDIFSEGLEYKLQGKSLAIMGSINKDMLKKFDIKQPVYVAEVAWPVLFELVKRDKVKYKELPKYPEVRRDLALLLDENITFAELRKSAMQAEKQLLKSVTLFDVYRGEKIPAGKKQYALNFVLQNPEATLTDADVEKIMNKLLTTFQSKHGAELR
ncbi:MAG: phenylalanine--tRNA ligase subunit beta [Bacteroidales bacterium]|nr:phenylalanine--tRNA ligase subunit beta [Bacteroidales bacterium]